MTRENKGGDKKRKTIPERLKERFDREVQESAEVYRLRNDLAAQKSATKALQKELEASEQRNAFVEELTSTQVKPVQIKFTKKSKTANAVAAIVLTDWHIEEMVEPATVNNLNAYSPDIASARLDRVAQKAVYLIDASRYLATINVVVLAILGDLINGYIHEEYRENNALSPIEASMFAKEKLSSIIDFILKESKPEKIILPCCYGNHGRTTKKMTTAATAYKNSYEWMVYNDLAKTYAKDSRLVWQIAKSYQNILEIDGRRNRFHHGHRVQYSGGVLGLGVPAEKRIARWDRSDRVDLDVFGHHHTYNATPKYIACPSLIGMTPYSHEASFPFEPPAQTYFVFDKKHGLTETKLIFCSDIESELAMMNQP